LPADRYGGTNSKEAMSMDNITIIVAVSIAIAGFAIALGGYGPARALGEALTKALEAIARQPDASASIMRTLFVGMALIESIAIYAFVIALIILFANPLLEYIVK
jgi:F-type H+-transporting ATPase subunit c